MYCVISLDDATYSATNQMKQKTNPRRVSPRFLPSSNIGSRRIPPRAHPINLP